MELANLTRRVLDEMRGKESSIENGLVVRRLEYKVGKKFKVLATEATSHRNFGLLLFWVLPNCSFRRCALFVCFTTAMVWFETCTTQERLCADHAQLEHVVRPTY